jgi:hypothetical protein
MSLYFNIDFMNVLISYLPAFATVLLGLHLRIIENDTAAKVN